MQKIQEPFCLPSVSNNTFPIAHFSVSHLLIQRHLQSIGKRLYVPFMAAQYSLSLSLSLSLSSQTLYANAMSSLKQLMEGLLQRQLDPKGLQDTVHVSYLAEGSRAKGGHTLPGSCPESCTARHGLVWLVLSEMLLYGCLVSLCWACGKTRCHGRRAR